MKSVLYSIKMAYLTSKKFEFEKRPYLLSHEKENLIRTNEMMDEMLCVKKIENKNLT